MKISSFIKPWRKIFVKFQSHPRKYKRMHALDKLIYYLYLELYYREIYIRGSSLCS